MYTDEIQFKLVLTLYPVQPTAKARLLNVNLFFQPSDGEFQDKHG
jgi:hypothetical protein